MRANDEICEGGRISTDTKYWDAPRVKLSLNLVALQRDVLKQRRDKIRWGPILFMGRSEELLEIRKRIQIIDNKWMSTRFKEDIDLRSLPLITSDEWGKLIVNGHIDEDWERWNAKESNGQRQVLENAGMITLRPAPGAAEEGSASGDGGLGREGFSLEVSAEKVRLLQSCRRRRMQDRKCRLAICL